MDQQQIKHENRERLCYYTNELYEEQDIVKYEMKDRGYGSIFDCDIWTLQLHKDVAKELDCKGILKPEWFNNESMLVCVSKFFSEYRHEEDIMRFVESLPIVNMEYILNSENSLIGSIDRNDWIADREAQSC